MLILVTVILLAFGLAMGFSASFVNGKTGLEQLFDQLRFVAIGFALIGVMMLAGYKVFSANRDIWFVAVSALWLLSLVCMALVFVPGLGVEVNGASRWLDLGPLPQFQPSEFAKLTLLLYSAAAIERYRYSQSRLLFAAIVFSYVALIAMTLLQKDLGSTMLLHLAFLAVLWFAEIPILAKGLKGLVSMASLIGIPAAFMAATYFLPSYRQSRWAGFMSPLDTEALTVGLKDADQIRNGFLALGGGNIQGLGFGLSKQKYFYLSFPHSDYIYAIVGEELGLIGALAVLLLFLAFAWFGLRIARNAVSPQGKMLAGGATSLIVFQALVNIGGVTGALPLTGKPLPFFSIGGSSMVFTLCIVGCILLVAWFDAWQGIAVQRRDAFRLVDGGLPVGAGNAGRQPKGQPQGQPLGRRIAPPPLTATARRR